MYFYITRCGIGTLSRNRSRAGSVDETQMRTACRSVTPTGSSSATEFHEPIAFTLPRNFETNKTTLSERQGADNTMENKEQGLISNGFRQAINSGM